MRTTLRLITAFFLVLTIGQPAIGQSNPFAPGWDMNSEASNLRFQSIKKGNVSESSSFATFDGAIEADGSAQINILLDSVDTKVDLRNVRMRFLFFETFKFPQATVSLKLTPEMIGDLATVRRKSVPVEFDLDLHGQTQTIGTNLVITLLTDDVVSVASDAPISISVADFNLSDNLKKLEEAASVTIVPTATLTFDFLFTRRSGDATAVASAAETPAPTSVALEAEGNFSLDACLGRFEILSRTGNIYFRSGSTRLDNESTPFLTSVIDIVNRCPDMNILVAGHTDSDGSEAANQRLSEARARSVAKYLIDNGVSADRITSQGFGEAQPVVPNDSAYNKSRNRRIEFSASG